MSIRPHQLRLVVSKDELGILRKIQRQHGLTRSEALRYLIHQVEKPLDIPTFKRYLPSGLNRKQRERPNGNRFRQDYVKKVV